MKKILTILCASILGLLPLRAQLGSIDSTFILGTGFGPDSWTGKCEAILQQSDGKLLVAGHFKSYQGDTALYLVRLNLDGSMDPGFSSSFEDSWGFKVNALAMQSDGKILVGGWFDEVAGVSRNYIARLNSDGSLDASFDPLSGFNQEVNALAVQSDGKIIVGGLFNTYDPNWGGLQIPVNGLARLNPDGSLDTTFNMGTGFSGSTGIGQRQIHQIVIQPDGKILVAGHFSQYNGQSAVLLVRLNSDGTKDNTFNADANFAIAMDGFYGQVYSLKLESSGKIIIGGNYGNTNSLAKGVDRLNSDGSLDQSFQVYHSTDVRNSALDLQSDGKILAANMNFGLPSEAYVVERYHSDGSLDTSFPKRFLGNEVRDLIIQSDGKITFVGYFSYNPTGIMRLIGDTPFSVGVLETDWVHFELYPNPAVDLIHLNRIPHDATVRIKDAWGKTHLSFNYANANKITLNLAELPAGMYFTEIEQQGSVSYKKFILNR